MSTPKRILFAALSTLQYNVPPPAPDGTQVIIVFAKGATNIKYTATVSSTGSGLNDLFLWKEGQAGSPVPGGAAGYMFTLSGKGGSGVLQWNMPGSSTTYAMGIMFPVSVAPPTVAASGTSTAAKVAIGVAAVGGVVGAMAVAGVASGNGAGWLFGAAEDGAAGAAEEVKRRVRGL